MYLHIQNCMRTVTASDRPNSHDQGTHYFPSGTKHFINFSYVDDNFLSLLVNTNIERLNTFYI